MLMTMRAGSFSTLVLLSLGVLLVLGAAVPAGAQVMTAGGDLDVYDDNGGIVGRLVDIESYPGHWVISVEAPDGDVATLWYSLSAATSWGHTFNVAGFDAPNCTGNVYWFGNQSGARTATGYTYAAMYLGVYKVDLNTAASGVMTESCGSRI